MGALIKKVITEVTFRDSVGSEGDIRYLKLRLDSEGAGRFFVLSSESDFDDKGEKLYFNSPDDLKLLYETAKEMWDQGSIYLDEEGW